eukprot:15233430-Alexandrium_andersonii.AAC.1
MAGTVLGTSVQDLTSASLEGAGLQQSDGLPGRDGQPELALPGGKGRGHKAPANSPSGRSGAQNRTRANPGFLQANKLHTLLGSAFRNPWAIGLPAAH